MLLFKLLTSSISNRQ